MRLSIFTPSHKPEHLSELYDSIKAQDFDEWVILLNGGVTYADLPKDPRIVQVLDGGGEPYVGRLKRDAVAHCTGDILVEVDHDDLLAPTAIAEIRRAFAETDAGFVYSNTVSANMDWTQRERYGAQYGWQFRPVDWNGHALDETISFEPTPASVSRIWYAPNHVRAFRREAYDAVGGYNAQMRVLDDLDLMCRLYQQTPFYHINEPLYLYRVNGENTWLKHNQEIQQNVWPIYDRYIERLALTWARRNNLLALDLGSGQNPAQGYKSVDQHGAHVNCDLNDSWPFDDGSAGVIRAADCFEHLRDPLHTMKELYRVLAPGGYALLQVPSTDGRGAFQDPTHVSFWNENSFLYYTDARWSRYIGTPVRFQAMRLYTTEPDERQVCWTRAHLLKLANQRPPGITYI